VAVIVTVKVEALRRLGEMLKASPKAKGVKGQFTGGTKSEPLAETVPTLVELGLTKKESAIAQKLAALLATVRALLFLAGAGGRSLSRFAHRHANPERYAVTASSRN
jgi:hypothetical protein